MAYSKSVGEYQMRMDELRAHGPAAHADLLAKEPKTWCLAFFSRNARSANVCNSLSESFNRTIKGAKELPLINMLETIRSQAMSRIAHRLKKAKACIIAFPHKISDILEANREDSKDFSVLTSSDNLFEVLLYGCSYEVSLRLCHCVCRDWDLTDIPCSHVIRVINENHQQPENHVDNYYKTEVWIATYQKNIKPVNRELYWEKTHKEPIGVPGFRKMPGRPKKKRIKSAHESPSKPNRVTRHVRRMTCGNCKQVGHNQLGCKNPTFVVQGPTRKRGRPRKIDDGVSNPRPRKKHTTTTPQSQPSVPLSTPQSQSSTVAPSTAPAPATAASSSSTAPPGHGRGRRG
ncbi:uncharacterized protein LOC112083132 [Eutrema salsugineum]|uniref:uncharacterized protein LOC112083132 n=1 Tax=Eutrema salsugineum TaxID=72664 RepID=UPI000CED79C5|nr:uncharacterized protein LOC112083132 [Eutrema salsugineum]